MLGTIGDLVEDVHVQVAGPLNIGSDTSATISRQRGGSAANVAVVAATIAGAARFIGQVGADPAGAALVDELVAAGVEPVVRRRGRSGCIVVLVHDGGERTMLPDRATCIELDQPDAAWLEGLHTLHVPFYSLAADPLATTARTMAGWARERRVAVSVDASSVAELGSYGLGPFAELLAGMGPDVVFCNGAEADLLGGLADPEALGAGALVVHRADGAEVRAVGAAPVRVGADPIDDIANTTGAGDAFAAGFLLARAGEATAADAAAAGHAAARRWLLRAGDDDHSR